MKVRISNETDPVSYLRSTWETWVLMNIMNIINIMRMVVTTNRNVLGIVIIIVTIPPTRQPPLV
jgi:hypothetical protein